MDVQEIALNLNIGQTSFTWRQALWQSKLEIYAFPTPEIQANIMRQAVELDKIYNLVGGFMITSWLRSEEQNRLVGGAPGSMHLTGLATDFVPTRMNPERARRAIRASGLYPGRMELNTPTWVHLDLKNNIDFIA